MASSGRHNVDASAARGARTLGLHLHTIPGYNETRMSTSIRTLRCLPCLALLGVGALAQAQNDPQTPASVSAEARAEAERLSDDLEKLAERQVWAGVEHKYEDLAALGVPLEQRDYLYGAYAARELGDVAAAYDRLQAAARMGGSKEIVDWLWDIDHSYGNVDLLMVPPRATELACDEMPMDPNQRKAVEAAVRAAKATGTYRGLLPQGKYSFGGVAFQVEPGVSVRIEVNPRVRKKGPAEPVIRYPQAPPTQGGTTAGAGGSTATGTGGTTQTPPPSDTGTPDIRDPFSDPQE